jgi:hypothetical protein
MVAIGGDHCVCGKGHYAAKEKTIKEPITVCLHARVFVILKNEKKILLPYLFANL